MARKRESIDPSNPPASDKRSRKRYIVYADDSGAPDLSTAPPELRAAFGGPDHATAAPAAAGGPAAAPAPAEFDSAIFKLMIPVLSGIEAVLVADRMGVSTEQAQQALTPPPPLADAIANAAAKVAAKYAAPLGRWAEEIALAALIVTWQTTAFANMRRMAPAAPPAAEPPAPIDRHESYQAPAPSAPAPSAPPAAAPAPSAPAPSDPPAAAPATASDMNRAAYGLWPDEQGGQ